MKQIPTPSIERLSVLSSTLSRLAAEGVEKTSSADLEKRTGFSACTIRKDISALGGAGTDTAGYRSKQLQAVIEKELGLETPRNCCIVGLGRMGGSILSYGGFADSGIVIKAGFDSSINVIELLRSPVPLYPAYEITEKVRELGIELAILTVPAEAALKSAQRLVDGGVRGILNFAPINLVLGSDVVVRNLFVVDELRVISALLAGR